MTLDLRNILPVSKIKITSEQIKQKEIIKIENILFKTDYPIDIPLNKDFFKEKNYEYELIQSGKRKFAEIETDSIEEILVLEKFFENSKDFWASTSQKVRRYTRKAIANSKEMGWKIQITKGKKGFDDKAFVNFYSQYLLTSQRQNFVIQPRQYLSDLFENEFCYIVLIKDDFHNTLSVWMGIESEQTLTYLYGGNSQAGLDNHSQYLIQLVAIALAKNLDKNFYDLGGYDANKGFGQFKDGYKGHIRSFIGVVDIVLKPRLYKILNLTRDWVKKLQNKTKH
jgi:lipid II:glycine glycyltransferase (peptidoglycan interpeptide bridge formation enzyme)